MKPISENAAFFVDLPAPTMLPLTPLSIFDVKPK
jgi:hypothetical protein